MRGRTQGLAWGSPWEERAPPAEGRVGKQGWCGRTPGSWAWPRTPQWERGFPLDSHPAQPFPPLPPKDS